MNFSAFRRGLLVLAAAAWPAVSAFADNYPSRPIKIIVGFAAGSAADSFMRPYAQKLSEVLSTPVIVENKPGAGQMTAIRALQAAPADGYTLYLGSGSSLAQGPGLRKDLAYDPLRDFALIGYLADLPGAIMVNASLPVKNVAEFVAYVKANPGKLNFGSSGMGSGGHLAGELFMSRTGTKMLHIPYKADTEAAREVAAGNIQAAFTTLRTAATMVEGGKVRMLAAIDSRTHAQLPGVPPITDVGVPELKAMVPYSWYALVAQRGLPPAVLQRLADANFKVNESKDYITTTQNAGVIPIPSSPVQLRETVQKEIAKWREVGKTVKLDF